MAANLVTFFISILLLYMVKLSKNVEAETKTNYLY